MGLEAQCTARFGGKTSRGKALLESEEIVFRGDFRLKIPFQAMKSVQAVGSELRIAFAGGTAQFDVGEQAAKWADRILHPKSLLDKLGVKAGASVSILNVSDAEFLKQLRGRTDAVVSGKAKKESDFVFFGAESKSALARLRALQTALKPAGAIWVVYPKGQAHITEADVLAAGKASGLVDVKVCSFSATHTALKMVIPVSRR